MHHFGVASYTKPLRTQAMNPTFRQPPSGLNQYVKMRVQGTTSVLEIALDGVHTPRYTKRATPPGRNLVPNLRPPQLREVLPQFRQNRTVQTRHSRDRQDQVAV